MTLSVTLDATDPLEAVGCMVRWLASNAPTAVYEVRWGPDNIFCEHIDAELAEVPPPSDPLEALGEEIRHLRTLVEALEDTASQ